MLTPTPKIGLSNRIRSKEHGAVDTNPNPSRFGENPTSILVAQTGTYHVPSQSVGLRGGRTALISTSPRYIVWVCCERMYIT